MKKKLINSLLALSLTVGIASSVSAAGSATMDNDPAFGGTAWTDKDANGAEVFIKESKSASYSGDDRIASKPTSNYYYHWKWSGSWTSARYVLEAYLNNVNFTNRMANYYANGYFIGWEDQYNAPGGWNAIGYKD